MQTLTMTSLGEGYRALVIGSNGAIAQAFAARLRADPRCGSVRVIGRGSSPALDLEQPDSIAEAARALASGAPFQLVLLATGVLHRPGLRPEKSLSALDAEKLQTLFQVNTIGPALVLRHFLPLLAADGAMAVLSAKVGSIGDNQLGGWYGYRASKAALNMLVRTAAIELARSKPQARLFSLHPGTVISPLSQPFRAGMAAREPAEAAGDLLALIDRLRPSDSGGFFAWNGERLPW